jgi:hypothetical protein
VSKEWKLAGSRPEKFGVQKVGRKNPHLIVVLRKFSEIGFKIADHPVFSPDLELRIITYSQNQKKGMKMYLKRDADRCPKDLVFRPSKRYFFLGD